MVEGGVGGVGRGRHAVAREELLRGGGGEGRVHGGAEGGGAGHPPRVQVLLSHHHHLVASDGGGEISNQFFLVLRCKKILSVNKYLTFYFIFICCFLFTKNHVP